MQVWIECQTRYNTRMITVLITGGTGTLGQALIDRLDRSQFTARIMSQRPRPIDLSGDIEWAQANLITGDGLIDAVRGASIVIHAASDFRNTQAVDVAGTARLISAAKSFSVSHFIYVSIVGIDRIPYDYYAAKLAAENIVARGEVPWTIARITQFHDLIDSRLTRDLKSFINFLPVRYQYQSIDVHDAVQALIEIAQHEPTQRVENIGGPQILRYGDMARSWLIARGLSKIILPKFPRGEYAHALTQGYNTCPQNKAGKITWREWLNQKAINK